MNLASYSAIVVASDFGGWLRQSELDILNARSTDILNYLNAGGGLVAFAESGPPFGLTTHGEFGYLPFLISSSEKNQSEVGNTVTPFGKSMGLTDSDVNGNASHNIFTASSGLNIVDQDSQGQILSLAFSGQLGPGGPSGVPEPSSLILLTTGTMGLLFYGRSRRRLAA